jgi:hypothetical protein
MPGPSLSGYSTAYQDVTNPSGLFPTTKHSVEHVLENSGRPVTARFRQMDSKMLLVPMKSFSKWKEKMSSGDQCVPTHYTWFGRLTVLKTM